MPNRVWHSFLGNGTPLSKRHEAAQLVLHCGPRAGAIHPGDKKRVATPSVSRVLAHEGFSEAVVVGIRRAC